MSAALSLPQPLPEPATTADLLQACGVNLAPTAATRRQPRQRCLSIVENGHRAAEASAYDAMAKGRPLRPPPLPCAEHVPSSAGAAVLQQEMRRGIVAKSRDGGLWAVMQ